MLINFPTHIYNPISIFIKEPPVAPIMPKRKSPKLLWEGAPSDPLYGPGEDPGWPDGWKKRIYERRGGRSKGRKDSYWYAPGKKSPFRSLKEAKKYIILEELRREEEEDSISFSDLQGREGPVPEEIEVIGGEASGSGAEPARNMMHRDCDSNIPNNCKGRKAIQVTGAGIQGVDGVYVADGKLDGVNVYSKFGKYKGHYHKFSVFRCVLSNLTRKWYISVVPKTGILGTLHDIDLYYAPATPYCEKHPPLSGWNGLAPVPTISHLWTETTDL